MITKINPTIPVVSRDGRAMDQLKDFFLEVALTGIIIGTGSPEGVVEALRTQEYMDDEGVAGAIKYIKRDADVVGDRSLGWILI
ncbi:unnamed protein product [marine sediment metagenome]|uniref:Uncharacterized protein n=1 Tax=marine sediment metagenome TaxID=412755 RepID=X0SED0_9ZZZZ